MKRRSKKQGVVSAAAATVKDYLEAMERIAQLASKLCEAESRLIEARTAKDEQLLSAVSQIGELERTDQLTLRQLVSLFGPGIAKTLLESIENGAAALSNSLRHVESPARTADAEVGK